MKNLIKMNLFRMKKMKSLYITTIIIFVFMVITAVSLSFVKNNVETRTQINSANEMREKSGINPGVQMGVNFKTDAFNQYKSLFSGNLLVFFTGLFVVLFYLGDMKNGYIKIYGGLYKHRSVLFFGKLIPIFIYQLILMLLTFLAEIILSKIIFKNGDLPKLGDFLSYFIVESVLLLAFFTIIAVICSIIRSSALSITLTIFLSMGFMTIIYFLIDIGWKKIFTYDLDISKYSLINKISSYPTEFVAKDFRNALALGACYLVVFLLLGTIINEKRDLC